MNAFPSRDTVAAYRKQYPAGTRIRLDYTDDPYTRLKRGDCATVTGVDDAGQLTLHWDSGSSLSLIIGHDRFTVLSE